MAALSGVSWVAATGDSGGQSLFPATSPNVLGVGGTSLKLNSDNSIQSETAWANSSGGNSALESKPAYQDSVLLSSATQRSAPDVAFDGNPNTGVVVYDSYDNGSSTPWSEEGGTSLGTPAWAGLVAIADQGRVAAGQAKLNTASSTELLTAIYSLAKSDFHDITVGSNKSYAATAGYDQVTGLGTPVANLLVPDLIAYGGNVALSPGAVAAGTVGSAYSQSITASGGDGIKTMTYSILSGSLPAGLAISTSTSELDITGAPQAVGSVTFKVTATDANGSATSQTYTLNVTSTLPSITGVAPAAGPLAGGTTVTISGTNLAGATAVKFGSALAVINNDSANQITVTSPTGLAGTVDITVTTPQGTSTLTAADQFSYVAPPAVSSVSPSSESSPGGLVTIFGSNLASATQVLFGTTPATIESDVAGQIVVVVPNVSGTVDVTVTTAGGTSASTSADQFSIVVSAPTVAFSQTPPANTNQNSATFAFTGTGDQSTTAGELSYEVSLDGAAFPPATNPVTLQNLANGTHTLQVEAVDLDNVASTPASYTWSVNTVAPTSQVSALPYATSQTSFAVSWSGSDGVGTGIAAYNVYVSTDGGAFAPWITATTQTSATFSGQLGHIYSFNSTATDFAGNTEAAHGTADATIALTATPWRNSSNDLDVNGDGTVTAIDALAIINYLNAQNPATLPATNTSGKPFLDVNGDNSVTALDALWIINYLNSQPAVSSGLASGGTTPSGGVAAGEAGAADAPSAAGGDGTSAPVSTTMVQTPIQAPLSASVSVLAINSPAAPAIPATNNDAAASDTPTGPASQSTTASLGGSTAAPAVAVSSPGSVSGMLGAGLAPSNGSGAIGPAASEDPAEAPPASGSASTVSAAVATSSTSGRLFFASRLGREADASRSLSPAAIDAVLNAWPLDG